VGNYSAWLEQKSQIHEARGNIDELNGAFIAQSAPLKSKARLKAVIRMKMAAKQQDKRTSTAQIVIPRRHVWATGLKLRV
jgi:hypothetical protein